jgi:hypothetical protein
VVLLSYCLVCYFCVALSDVCVVLCYCFAVLRSLYICRYGVLAFVVFLCYSLVARLDVVVVLLSCC